MAHYEPPHQYLHFLQIQLFSSLVLKELNFNILLTPMAGLMQNTEAESSSMALPVHSLVGWFWV